jgi:uncharacterized membrane-anchored protein YhcB (DUF1043 family)
MEKSKPEFLKSKLFHFLTQIVLPVAAIAISVYFYYAGKEQREVTITGIQLTNLVETKSEVSNEVIVTYKGDTIYNTVRFFLELKNTGNKSIVNQDVYKLNWIAPDSYQIIDASIDKSNDNNPPIETQIINLDTLKINITAFNKNAIGRISILCISKKQKTFNNSRIDAIIADCDIINRINDYQIPKTEPFWKQVFLGNWGVQAVKLVVYFIIAAIIAIVIALAVTKVSSIIDKKKTKNIVADLQKNLFSNENIKVKYPEYFNETYDILSSLSKDELAVLEKMWNFSQKDTMFQLQLVSDKMLAPNEKIIFDNLVQKYKKLNSIIDYSSIYYTEGLLEFFLTGKISKPLSP